MNAFEMLWNVDKNSNNFRNSTSPLEIQSKGADASTTTDEAVHKMGSSKTVVDSKKKIMGHALTIKEEFIR